MGDADMIQKRAVKNADGDAKTSMWHARRSLALRMLVAIFVLVALWGIYLIFLLLRVNLSILPRRIWMGFENGGIQVRVCPHLIFGISFFLYGLISTNNNNLT
jgi:hypothetical protein